VVAYFGGMKLSQVTTATIKAYVKHRRSEERIVSRERTILNGDGTVTVVPEVRRKPSNAQIDRETTVLGRMVSLARQDDKIINRPHIPKLKEPAQPRKGFFEYGDFVKVRDHLDPALRNIAEFEYVTGWRIDTEVLPLLWRQVDFAAGEVRIDDPRSTKNEQARVFPFTRDLRRTLEAQRKLTGGLDSPYVFCHLAGVRVGKRFSYSGLATRRSSGRRRSRSARFQENRDQESRARRRAPISCDGDGGQKTEEVYRRYAIVDEAMIREAAVKDGPRGEGSANYCTIESAIGGSLKSLAVSIR
jgi:integrase